MAKFSGKESAPVGSSLQAIDHITYRSRELRLACRNAPRAPPSLNLDADCANLPAPLMQHGFEARLQLAKLGGDRRVGRQQRPTGRIDWAGFHVRYKCGGQVGTNGIEAGLIGFIESDKVVDKETWLNFDRLTFKTGSAELDMDKSKDQLNNMFEILKAFPNVKLKVGGYTDNTGDANANLKLSSDRASAVKSELIKLGISDARVESEGYGIEHPIATNDTEEGRAANRRTSVRVTEK